MIIFSLLRGLLRFFLLVAGLVLIVVSSLLFVDRALPARVRELLAGTPPKVVEWREEASDFSQGTRKNVEAITAENGGLALRPGAVTGEYLSTVHLFANRWNALGVEWNAPPVPQTRTRIDLHYSADGKKWGDWEQVEVEEDLAAENVNYSRLIFVGAARYLQYRVSFSTENPLSVPRIHRLRFVAFDTNRVRPEPPLLTRDPKGHSIRLITRAEWGADETYMTRAPEYARPTKIVIHHAGGINLAADNTSAVRAMYLYHAITRGFGDLAYNYMIDVQGNIYEGRAGGDNVAAQHARQYSYGSIGIALLGDYDEQPLSDESKNALADLIAYLANRYGIDPQGSASFYDLADVPNVMTHRDIQRGSLCPGQFLANALPEIRAVANARLRDRAPTIALYGIHPDKPLAGRKAVVAVSEAVLTNQVEFYLDEELVYTVKQPTNGNQYIWEWDTTRLMDGNHSVKIIARGSNQSDAVLKNTFIVDNTSPQTQIVINDGATYTRVPTLTLTVQGTDLTGIAQMLFVDPNGNAISEPEPYTLHKNVLLQPGDGARIVALRFVDESGNRSPVVSAKIILDTQPPENWREFSNAANYATVLISDKTSGVNPSGVGFAVSDDGMTWSEFKPAHAEWDGKSQTVRVLVPEYVQKPFVRFIAQDRAGNTSVSPAYPINAPTTLNVAALTLPKDDKPIVTLGPNKPVTSTLDNKRVSSPSAVTTRADLVIDQVQVQPRQVAANGAATFLVALHNRGISPADGFWAGLWIDPAQPPRVNSADPTHDNLILWHVPALGANEVLVLTSNSPYAPYTTYSGRLAAGTHQIYVLVDALNPGGASGLVSEVDENNNLSGPVAVNVQGELTIVDQWLLRFFDWWERVK